MPGILLINLGTPEVPYPRAVARYLREFLMDPFVLDIPWISRWLLVHLAILPFRSSKSAEAYQKIWTERGSPLGVEHLDLTSGVAALRPQWIVEAGMRYGEPSIPLAMEKLVKRGVTEIIAFALYPQYALASTETAKQVCEKWARKLKVKLRWIDEFYDHPQYLEAVTQVSTQFLVDKKVDHYLFSFHSIPERQVTKIYPEHCLKNASCCDQITSQNQHCYRAQCYATAHRLADKMKLAREKYTVSFQSRLGRTPWLKPYTDFMYEELAQRGVRRLAVFCPSFVADCLETLEEIAMRGREDFRRYGGEELYLVPSLNHDPRWVQSVIQMLEEHFGKPQ